MLSPVRGEMVLFSGINANFVAPSFRCYVLHFATWVWRRELSCESIEQGPWAVYMPG